MKLMRKALVASIALAAASAAGAPAFAQDAPTAGHVNVSLLPVSLHRIQRAIHQSSSTDTHEGLRILYQVDVYGRAPVLEFFTKGDDVVNGPVPNSAPTHKQMLEMMTPQEYRAPVADFSALMRWLADKGNKK
jgi:hypothetical protein